MEAGSVDEARALAAETEKLVGGWLNPKLMRNAYHLKGIIELRQKEYSAAIGYFQNAISFLNFQYCPDHHALLFEPLALAFYKSGDLLRALEQYEKITQLTTGRLYYGDIYARSFFMLGKIAEQQGDKARARESYRKFLDLWKDADPGLPEVEDAKKRLAEPS